MSSVATQWLPKKKNPLQIVDLQGINFLYPYPGPGSNRHGFPLVFETNASTNSATWASVCIDTRVTARFTLV